MDYDKFNGSQGCHLTHRRRFLQAILTTGVASTSTLWHGWAQTSTREITDSSKEGFPASGPMEPGTEEFNTAALELISEGEVPAAQLCVSKDGKIVLNRAYGYLDAGKNSPLPLNARFRLASLDKVITGTAIHRLIEDRALIRNTGEKMRLDLHPFQLFQKMGISAPADSKTDPRLFDITVKHLLDHSSGLDQGVHSAQKVQKTLELSGLPKAVDAIRYHFTKSLSFDPGSKSSYNSAGYWVLRLLVELAGGSFIGYLKKEIFGPAKTNDICLSHTRPSDRDPLEVRYQCQGSGPSLFPDQKGQVIPLIDGGGEYNDNHLVMAASAEAVARFLSYWYFGEAKRLWTERPSRLAPGLNNGWGFFHGGMTGIRTMMFQRRWSMCNVVLLTNWVRDRPGVKPQDFAKKLEQVCKRLNW